MKQVTVGDGKKLEIRVMEEADIRKEIGKIEERVLMNQVNEYKDLKQMDKS